MGNSVFLFQIINIKSKIILNILTKLMKVNLRNTSESQSTQQLNALQKQVVSPAITEAALNPETFQKQFLKPQNLQLPQAQFSQYLPMNENMKAQLIKIYNLKISEMGQGNKDEVLREMMEVAKTFKETSFKSYQHSEITESGIMSANVFNNFKSDISESQISVYPPIKQQKEEANRDYYFKSNWDEFDSHISMYSQRIVHQIKKTQTENLKEKSGGKNVPKNCQCQIM